MNATFPIVPVLDAIEHAVSDLPKASMHELADDGFQSLFQQVVACLISIRTYEEVTMPICQALFAVAPDPAAMLALGEDGVLDIIRRSTFADRKAGQIIAIARETIETHGGEIPCDRDIVLGFNGIGPKCANLALGIACMQYGTAIATGGAGGGSGDGVPGEGPTYRPISVDIHVHRVTNRWGVVNTKTPEKTTIALEAVLPPSEDVRINRLLVPFGKFICTGNRPKCSTCPVRDACAQVGVTNPR
ncbi:MAG TPA: hypothetical protein VGT61_08210 [Thermomicrobiales bacterium]|jgi:endonuclease-3|nr:hypothetical protein [Thermomicrobiales bacterium]